jgi:cytochrome c oxidase accessory protein FixG
MMKGSPQENWTYFLLISSGTALLMFNFGWFREQFCIIMCPYGRFQSVLMDSDSVTVAYDFKRGEPRKGSVRGQKTGDCISCNRCVEVCPTAIDIRKGLQLECIGCTACIDACNAIMKRVNKAPDLIGYKSLSGRSYQIARPRVLATLGLALACLLVLVISLSQRKAFAISILRATDTPYQLLPEEKVMNHFKVHFLNQSQAQEEFIIALPPEITELGAILTQAIPTTTVNSGESTEMHFFLTFPKTLLRGNGSRHLKISIQETHTGTVTSQELTVVGP